VDLARRLKTLLVAGAVPALPLLLVALLPGPRIPQVVILLVGGVLIGPEVLGWADRPAIDLLANVGLGLLFLLAGYELDLHLFRERPGRLAMAGWLITAVLAAGLVGVLAAAGLVRAFIPVALGLTTTSLGTLLPILRDNDMLGGRFGRYLLAAGAVGELFQIFAIALFLGRPAARMAQPVDTGTSHLGFRCILRT
jgi:Kef-type K+ transport system membrane component KefB